MKLRRIVFLILAAGAVRAAEGPYGRVLEARAVEGIGPCKAVEAAGDRLYAAGQGILYVLDIAKPAKPSIAAHARLPARPQGDRPDPAGYQGLLVEREAGGREP